MVYTERGFSQKVKNYFFLISTEAAECQSLEYLIGKLLIAEK